MIFLQRLHDIYYTIKRFFGYNSEVPQDPTSQESIDYWNNYYKK